MMHILLCYTMKLNFMYPVLAAGLIVVVGLIFLLVFSETFGAGPDAAGNPVGGGAGYSRISPAPRPA